MGNSRISRIRQMLSRFIAYLRAPLRHLRQPGHSQSQGKPPQVKLPRAKPSQARSSREPQSPQSPLLPRLQRTTRLPGSAVNQPHTGVLAPAAWWRQFAWPDTLRGRLRILLVFVTITPIVLIGFTSYFWFFQAQTEKINASYQSMLTSERDALEKAFANLVNVSQLLVVNGGLGDDISNYITNDDPVEKTKKFIAIDKTLTNIIYSNPSIHGLFIYFVDYHPPIQFESAPLKPSYIAMEQIRGPIAPLFIANQLFYSSPRPSVLHSSDATVLSMLRPIEYGTGRTYYIYLETELDQYVQAAAQAEGQESGMAVYHLLTGSDGTIQYSDLPFEIAPGTSLADEQGRLSAFKMFTATGKNGWQLISLVPRSSYEHELKQWRLLFVVVSCLSLVLTVTAASYIWRMVYRPLQAMNKAMNRFSHDGNHLAKLQTRLVEFDMIYASFREMSYRIVELIDEVELKEKRKGELEVEKLIAQINPHFLHNTLNTIQWLALDKGQQEIYNLIKVFTRVLQYNMGKSSMIVAIREEAAALADYIELQNIRYDHRFKVNTVVAPDVAEVPIPRFVLQPIVENALYHGLLSEQGHIWVEIARVDQHFVRIRVADNGAGMEPDRIRELLEGGGGRNAGLGIGLNYVKKMLDVYYGETATMHIESVVGEGTQVMILIPDQVKGGRPDDQGIAGG